MGEAKVYVGGTEDSGRFLKKLFQKHPNQFSIKPLIRLIPHGEVQPDFFVYNAFAVGEGVEACFPVIRTHAAFAKAAKAHFTGGQMDDGIVDTAAAEAAA